MTTGARRGPHRRTAGQMDLSGRLLFFRGHTCGAVHLAAVRGRESCGRERGHPVCLGIEGRGRGGWLFPG